MRKKGILIDLFGTMIPRPDRARHDDMMVEMAEGFLVDRNTFEQAWHSTYIERISGKGGTTKEFMEYLGTKLGRDQREMAENAHTIWFEFTRDLLHFFDDVIPSLQRMRTEGIRTGLLTNCGNNIPELIERSAISNLFDTKVYSSVEGVHKPRIEFFMTGLERLGTSPEDTIFVGDGDNGELEGATNAGIRAVKIDRGEIAGDYRVTEDVDWEPTIASFNELFIYL